MKALTWTDVEADAPGWDAQRMVATLATAHSTHQKQYTRAGAGLVGPESAMRPATWRDATAPRPEESAGRVSGRHCFKPVSAGGRGLYHRPRFGSQVLVDVDSGVDASLLGIPSGSLGAQLLHRLPAEAVD
jgi:hypothetical protein